MAEENKRVYSKIEDPYSCPIEDLKAEVERLEGLAGFFDSQQQAVKIFLNSCYGYLASEYAVAHNVDVAEAITMQGQDLNHFTENCINRYFSGIFQNDETLHKELGVDHEIAKAFDIDMGRVTQQGQLDKKEFWFLEGDKTLAVCGDTDSTCSLSTLYIYKVKQSVEEKSTIEDLYNRCLEITNKITHTPNGAEILAVKDLATYSFNTQSNKIELNDINYIMRHKVSKQLYKITSKSNNSIEVTEDHSCMVYRDGKVIKIKPQEINPKTDKLVVMDS